MVKAEGPQPPPSHVPAPPAVAPLLQLLPLLPLLLPARTLRLARGGGGAAGPERVSAARAGQGTPAPGDTPA